MNCGGCEGIGFDWDEFCWDSKKDLVAIVNNRLGSSFRTSFWENFSIFSIKFWEAFDKILKGTSWTQKILIESIVDID